MSVQVETAGLTLPLEIRNIAVVDDAGDEHIECQMTAAYLVDLYRSELLKLTGNIRPSHNVGKLSGKTKTKVEKWTRELLNNDAIIGNISVRLDPTHSEYDIWFDEETGQDCLTITEGVLDCAVDSLSRIKAILGAAENPLGTFNLNTRFQVRIWMLNDEMAKKVATIYNTRGDKVNDSTAKYAYSETKEQELARRLVNGSPHLGQDNIEVLFELSLGKLSQAHGLQHDQQGDRELLEGRPGDDPRHRGAIELADQRLGLARQGPPRVRDAVHARPSGAAQGNDRVQRGRHLRPDRRDVNHVRRPHRPR